jgi:hypothetical protein
MPNPGGIIGETGNTGFFFVIVVPGHLVESPFRTSALTVATNYIQGARRHHHSRLNHPVINGEFD